MHQWRAGEVIAFRLMQREPHVLVEDSIAEFGD